MVKQVYISFILIIFMSACGANQGGPKSEIDSFHDFKVNPACPNANFYQNVLNHNNLNNIFQCLELNKTYPRLYQRFLQSRSEVEALAPSMNQIFYGTNLKRKTSLSLLAQVARQQGVAEWGPYVANITDPRNRLDKILHKLTQTGVLDKMLHNNKLVLSYTHLYAQTMNALANTSEKFDRDYLNHGLKQDRNEMLKQVFPSLLNSEVLRIASRFVYHDDWPMQVLRQNAVDDIIKMITIPADDIENLQEASRRFLQLSDSRLVCRMQGSRYVFHQKRLYNDLMYALLFERREDFLNDFLNLFHNFSFFEESCSRLIGSPYSLGEVKRSMRSLLQLMQALLVIPGGDELIKNLVWSALTSNNFEPDNYATFGLLASEASLSYMQYLKKMQESTVGQQHFRKWVTLIKNLPDEFFIELSHFLKHLSEDQELVMSLHRFWENLTESEKDNLLQIIDLFYFYPGDLKKTTILSLSLFTQFPHLSHSLAEHSHIVSSLVGKISRNFNYDYQQEMVHFLQNKEFSRLLELLDFDKQRTIAETTETRTTFRPIENIDASYQQCFDWMGEVLDSTDFDFWNVIGDYPSSCRQLNTHHFSSLIFDWTRSLDTQFVSLYRHRFSVPNGVVSPRLMRYYLKLMFIVDRNIEHSNDYVRKLVRSLKRKLFDRGVAHFIDKSMIAYDKLDHTLGIDREIVKNLSRGNLNQLKRSSGKVLSYLAHRSNEQGLKNQAVVMNPSYSFSQTKWSQIVHELDFYLRRGPSSSQKLFLSFMRVFSNSGLVYKGRVENFPLSQFLLYIQRISASSTTRSVLVHARGGRLRKNLVLSQRLELALRSLNSISPILVPYVINIIADSRTGTDIIDNIVGILSNPIVRSMIRGASKTKALDDLEQVISSFQEALLIDFTDPLGRRILGVDFFRSLASAIAVASPLDARSSSLLTLTRRNLAYHSGHIMGTIAKFSLFTQLGRALTVIERTPRQLEHYKSFLRGTDKLVHLFSINQWKQLQSLFDRSDHKMAMIQMVASYFVKDLSAYDVVLLKNIFSILSFTERGNISSRTAQFFIEHFSSFKEKYSFFTEDPIAYDLAWHAINFCYQSEWNCIKLTNNFLTPSKLSALLGNQEIPLSVQEALSSYHRLSPQIKSDSLLFTKKILRDSAFSLTPLFDSIRSLRRRDRRLTYVLHVLQFLHRSKRGHTQLYWGLREIFVESDQELVDFLEDIFDKIQMVEL